MDASACRYAAAAVLVVALVLPLGSLADPASGGEQAGQQDAQCGPAETQPEEPLAMNMVRTGDLVKTIATVKEVFICVDAAGDIFQIRDLETFVEIVEAKRGTAFRPLAGRTDIVECVKDLAEGIVSCGSRSTPLRPTQRPLAGCSAVSGSYPFDPIEQPRRPLEMQTVVLGNLVKTVKLDKEILECRGLIGDVYLFTDIVEQRGAAPGGRPTLRRVSTEFTGIVCFKDPEEVRLVECRSFTPTRRTPR